ncbi:MAG: hypothetical protein ABIH41_07055 [Nanoarchaeota archaeon]
MVAKDHNTVTYGPHLFPGGPEPYIRRSDLEISTGEAHRNIRDTLVAAFSNGNPHSILAQVSERFGLECDTPARLAFMNYGNMQLVYLATLADDVRVAALINQPHTPLGKVREEFDTLQRLVEIDPRFVVEPLAHFSMRGKGHELYASRYVDNAMCIAVNGGQGVYDPLPRYHFEGFAPEISHAVNSTMIALLVNYHDGERGKGISKTQTSGDDFILTRDFTKDNPSTVQPNMRLIAARGLIDVSLDAYLAIVRQEFLIGTNRDDPAVLNGQMRVNTRSALPMTEQEIEDGIELGLRLREQRGV